MEKHKNPGVFGGEELGMRERKGEKETKQHPNNKRREKEKESHQMSGGVGSREERRIEERGRAEREEPGTTRERYKSGGRGAQLQRETSATAAAAGLKNRSRSEDAGGEGGGRKGREEKGGKRSEGAAKRGKVASGRNLSLSQGGKTDGKSGKKKTEQVRVS